MSKYDLTNPARHVFLITPHDTNHLEVETRGIAIGTAGDLRILDASGRDVVIPSNALAVGVIHPIRVKQVFLTNTAASEIVGYA